MAEQIDALLTRWLDAGILDGEAADRIRTFERQHTRGARLEWPVWLAATFGALMVGLGVLLFVYAHWDGMSPTARMAVVLSVIGAFHGAAALASPRFPAMGGALHGIGTVAFGGGIFLAGQIFNLSEHWPGGLLLWTIGAAAGWLLLRSWPQFALVALLAPAWLSGEWLVASEFTVDHQAASRVLAVFGLSVALAYATAARRGTVTTALRRTLRSIGILWLLPAALGLAIVAKIPAVSLVDPNVSVSTSMVGIGWAFAIGLPLLLGVLLRGEDVWPLALAAAWAFLVVHTSETRALLPFFWWGLGAVGLTAWGMLDGDRKRINVGIAIFAVTVLTFYVSNVMTSLGRSASLVGFGLLFLAGGWALERVRRHLVRLVAAEGDRS